MDPPDDDPTKIIKVLLNRVKYTGVTGLVWKSPLGLHSTEVEDNEFGNLEGKENSRFQKDPYFMASSWHPSKGVESATEYT